MDFNPVQILPITKPTIELTNPSGSCDLVENRSRRSSRFKDSAVVFDNNYWRDLPSSYNRPLYVTTNLKRFELKRAMLDLESLLNIIPLSVLDAVGIPRDKSQGNRLTFYASKVTILT